MVGGGSGCGGERAPISRGQQSSSNALPQNDTSYTAELNAACNVCASELSFCSQVFGFVICHSIGIIHVL